MLTPELPVGSSDSPHALVLNQLRNVSKVSLLEHKCIMELVDHDYMI